MKRMVRRGFDKRELTVILKLLTTSTPLPHRYKDHKLTGNYSGTRECHIRPDWLLIYRLEEGFVILERTGTHTDLFD